MKTLFCTIATLALASASALAQAPAGWEGAFWVWDQPEANVIAQSNDPRYLRRVFTLADKPAKAELKITADNHYEVFVNGRRVGADGEWSTVEKYDVAKLLVPGKNLLAIKATNQGGPAGVFARLRVQGNDVKELILGTDAQTKISQVAGADWLTVDFDDSPWAAAIVLGDASIGPWGLAGSAAVAGDGNLNINVADPKIKNRLSALEQLKLFIVPKDFEVELVVADPLVINPITMTLDEKGRMIVSESHTYRYGPSGSPVKPFANPVIRLDPLPDGKGFKRTLVADGFDDPVMGIAVKGNKLWLTANNYLYQYDLTEEGKAINKKALLVDKNKAWNPFGMFVIEWGPDGLLYMSVGNHAINIEGPNGKISGRGASGIVLRMKPDGSDMQRLVHGLRVPYSFEYDPFGQLWVLSNGEGNPDRFVRVLDGVDYHCYSRGAVDNSWLAGNHPLAPPCFNNMRGAHTQLLRYYGAAFPEAYQGNLLCDNWGAHGFAGPNRCIFRFVPDARGDIAVKESFMACKDPHFRPSHIVLDPDGNLLVADWYGRDDESDMTGRIWRVKYVGKDRPQSAAADLQSDEGAVAALGSAHHLIREKATEELIRRGDRVVPQLAEYAAGSKSALGAAQALWTLLRIDTPASKSALAAGAKHADWKVRRLAVNLLRRSRLPGAAQAARHLAKDADPAVRLEAALALAQPGEIAAALLDALNHGAAKDAHLRYEAAWHLGKNADAEGFARLLASDDDAVRLAGMIAIDVACYEEFPSKKTALEALARALEAPGKLDVGLLLTLVHLDGDKSVIPALEKLAGRADIPLGMTAKALVVLKSKTGGLSGALNVAARKRLLEAVEKGAIPVSSPQEQLLVLEFLEGEGPTDFALKQVANQIKLGHPLVRPAALAMARKFGTKSAPLADVLWPQVLSLKTKSEDRLDPLATLAHIEATPRKASWEKLLAADDPLLRTDAVRWWRTFKGQAGMVELLVQQAPELIKKDPGVKDDLAVVLRQLDCPPALLEQLNLPEPAADKTALSKTTAAAYAVLTPAKKKAHGLLGRQVFERAGCVKCHTIVTQNTPLAPSLKGIAAQKVDYLIESVLFPSKIIKTGFETEVIVTKNGQTHSGLVREEGAFLRVLNLDKDVRIAKSEVEERSVQRISIMPEGQEAQMSRREFADLIAYLMTLK
jgi:quinoprotein glucose dehydrogenase